MRIKALGATGLSERFLAEARRGGGAAAPRRDPRDRHAAPRRGVPSVPCGRYVCATGAGDLFCIDRAVMHAPIEVANEARQETRRPHTRWAQNHRAIGACYRRWWRTTRRSR